MGTNTMRMCQLLKSHFDVIDRDRAEKAKVKKQLHEAQFGVSTIVPRLPDVILILNRPAELLLYQ